MCSWRATASTPWSSNTLSYGYSEGAMVGIRVMVLDEDLADARKLFGEYQP